MASYKVETRTSAYFFQLVLVPLCPTRSRRVPAVVEPGFGWLDPGQSYRFLPGLLEFKPQPPRRRRCDPLRFKLILPSSGACYCTISRSCSRRHHTLLWTDLSYARLISFRAPQGWSELALHRHGIVMEWFLYPYNATLMISI